MAFELSALTTVVQFVLHLIGIETASYRSAGKANAKHFAYEGFNASALLTNLMNVMKTNTSDDEAFEELVDLVNIGLTRGNIRTDQLNKTSKKGKDRIEELAKKYNIKMRKSKTEKINLTNETLTFTRIVSIVPFVASQLIRAKIVIIEPISCQFGSNNLPSEMKHPGFACLIPGTGYWSKIIFNAYLAYMISFGSKINPNDNSEIIVKYEKQKQFTLAAWTSKAIYGNETRIEAFSKLELNNADKWSKIYISVANELMKAIKKPLFEEEKAAAEIKDKLITY